MRVLIAKVFIRHLSCTLQRFIQHLRSGGALLLTVGHEAGQVLGTVEGEAVPMMCGVMLNFSYKASGKTLPLPAEIFSRRKLYNSTRSGLSNAC